MLKMVRRIHEINMELDIYKKIGFSSKWGSDLVVKKYKNECLKHKNSMFFARPFDNSWMYVNK